MGTSKPPCFGSSSFTSGGATISVCVEVLEYFGLAMGAFVFSDHVVPSTIGVSGGLIGETAVFAAKETGFRIGS